MKKGFLLLLFSVLFYTFGFGANKIKVGADQSDKLLPLLKNKNVALVVNHTSCLSDGTHLLDALLSNHVNVVKIFAPEHGFRGNADAGEQVSDDKDTKLGLGAAFFKSPKFMNLLSGTANLQRQIIAGQSEETIRKTWQKGLDEYKQMRKKYLLYEDK